MKHYSRQYIHFLFMLIVFTITLGYTSGYAQNPILVLKSENSFGPYTGELLKTEGFNEYQMEFLTANKVTPIFLKQFDVIILTAISLTDQQATTLINYVKEGGHLIAFKPDKKLHAVFGISQVSGTMNNAYVSIDPNNDIGQGLTTQTLQTHVTADEYILKDGEKIAALYKDASGATEYPAVVSNKYGKGQGVCFSYNLPQSIAYTRQGNYQYAGKEMDGITGIRAMDLFTNGWVDTTKNIINQADEQLRLLSHSIEKMSTYTKPLPRFWYFPDTLKCLVTLNNDGEDTKEAQFTKQFEDVDAKGAKMTLYVKEVDFISKEWIQHWAGKGFEMSGHPDDTKQATNPDWKTMDTVFKGLNNRLTTKYGIEPMRTVTNHWFVWCGKNEKGEADYTAQVQIEKNNGIEMDCNYAHYDNGSNQGHFLGSFGTNQGNYTGSGLTIKYANLQGDVIDVYQHFNNVYDQQYMEHDDKDGFFNCFKGLVDRSLDAEIYSFVSVKAHNAEYFFSEKPLGKMLDYANSKNIPVWTEIKFLDFMRAKDEASFKDITWNNNQLSFSIQSALRHTSGITCMIPFVSKGKKISSITSNGANQKYAVRWIKGYQYVLVTVSPGAAYNIVATYAASN
ncbi:hypothetical protein FC093_20970 [Ilyomonas limi]|uniref:Uncharacterized protein n=1 Tax=Ilyomonas limi TaxID=2575867 RepID=A0A4U3KS57_9BACT|nr:hypothetical protein [Ilyomonas limi]TKK65140.1 hypothetical protein FC093_20970 [Ilyomonas limi]